MVLKFRLDFSGDDKFTYTGKIVSGSRRHANATDNLFLRAFVWMGER
jgi:hypothetical protein